MERCQYIPILRMRTLRLGEDRGWKPNRVVNSSREDGRPVQEVLTGCVGLCPLYTLVFAHTHRAVFSEVSDQIMAAAATVGICFLFGVPSNNPV